MPVVGAAPDDDVTQGRAADSEHVSRRGGLVAAPGYASLVTAGCTEDGAPVPARTAQRLACDAAIVMMIEDANGNPLSVGRKTRVVSTAIKRALLQRDKTCRFPGCANRLYLHSHHCRAWAAGGETDCANCCSLCSLHHRFVHELGYTVVSLGGGEFEFRTPRGHVVPVVPDLPNVSAGTSWQRIRAQNAALGIHGTTAGYGWDGVPIDYSAVVGSLVGELNIQATCSWSADEDEDEYVPPLDPLADVEDPYRIEPDAVPSPVAAPIKTPEERRAENLALALDHLREVEAMHAREVADLERKRQALRERARERRRRRPRRAA
jgi:hypothetical protein